MAIYVPGSNFFRRMIIRINNRRLFIDNLKNKNYFNYKRLLYKDIIKIEFNCFETPEFIEEKMIVDSNNIEQKEFTKIIGVLSKYKVLKWKRHYYANFDYYDGTVWHFKITFENGKVFESEGDIIFPKKFGKVYDSFKKYICVLEEEN